MDDNEKILKELREIKTSLGEIKRDIPDGTNIGCFLVVIIILFVITLMTLGDFHSWTKNGGLNVNIVEPVKR